MEIKREGRGRFGAASLLPARLGDSADVARLSMTWPPCDASQLRSADSARGFREELRRTGTRPSDRREEATSRRGNPSDGATSDVDVTESKEHEPLSRTRIQPLTLPGMGSSPTDAVADPTRDRSAARGPVTDLDGGDSDCMLPVETHPWMRSLSEDKSKRRIGAISRKEGEPRPPGGETIAGVTTFPFRSTEGRDEEKPASQMAFRDCPVCTCY